MSSVFHKNPGGRPSGALLLRCRTLPRRLDDGGLGGCCFGGCLGGHRLTPLSLLALTLRTRTLGAISLTIS